MRKGSSSKLLTLTVLVAHLLTDRYVPSTLQQKAMNGAGSMRYDSDFSVYAERRNPAKSLHFLHMRMEKYILYTFELAPGLNFWYIREITNKFIL
jgi:hypothetical protein